MQSISLREVDGVHVTTLMDNSSDVLLPDEGGLVRRWGLNGTAGPLPVIPDGMAEDGNSVDFLRAEHGFSALVEPTVDGHTRRVLFDAGITPDGLIGNLDRLGIAPDTFEAVVFSHGHFDHVMGIDGVARRLGRTNMPVLVHPDFWTKRRLVGPDAAFELPTPSRQAMEGVGFVIIEDRQPSFLLDGQLLITGEVDRTTDFELGMPPAHQKWHDGGWHPDQAVHDDQAVVLHVRGKGLVVLTGCGHSGHRQHRPARQTDHRHREGVCGARRVPPPRRRHHPQDRHRARRREPGRGGARPLHQLEGAAGAGGRPPRRVPAQRRRQLLPAVGHHRSLGVAAVSVAPPVPETATDRASGSTGFTMSSSSPSWCLHARAVDWGHPPNGRITRKAAGR